MYLFIISAAFIILPLACITARLRSCLFNAFPPQVPHLLAGYTNGLLYALNPCAFLTRCQEQYGHVYRVSLGHWRLIVVSSGDMISSVFTAASELSNDIMHREMFDVIAGVTTNFPTLHQVMVHELFPLIDRALSPRSLGRTTEGFGLALLSQINKFTHDLHGPLSLTELTHEPLYTATNLVLLGSAFPATTYRDFRIVSQSVPYRFARTLLWRWPSYAARARLLNSLEGYLKQGEVSGRDDKFCHQFIQAFKDKNIQSSEGATLVLNFLWGIHSNILSNALFLLSFLLGDSTAFVRVRAEIDLAVEEAGGLETLLQAGPEMLDNPSFQLLTSAIMETLRLTALHVGIREATRDFNLTTKDGAIPVKKGELVYGNVQAVHMDATVYANPRTFVVDRFAQQPYRKKHLQTGGYPFCALGGGRHICKGRWLAMYQIKSLVIILLSKFDFRPAGGEGAGWPRLRVHTRSVGVVHTEDDIFVRLSPREARVMRA